MPYLKTVYTITIVICCFSSSCIQRAYYYSPLQGNSLTYHAIPIGSDSTRSATYVSGSISVGGMNDRWTDKVYSFKAGIHRSYAIENLRLYIGAVGVVGSYNINGDYFDHNYLDSSIYRNAGNKFFGAFGLNAGLSASTRMGRRGEWRYIGVEGSFFNEFGDYYSFRKNLPDSAADIIDKKKYMGSLGISTELIFKTRSQTKFGIKIAMGSYLRRGRYYDNYSNNYYLSGEDLLYFSNTYHFTLKKLTTYFQLNAATKAGHFQFGVNYRL